MNNTPNLIGLRATCMSKQAGLRSLIARAAKSFKKGWNSRSGTSAINARNIPTSTLPPAETLVDAKRVKIPSPPGWQG
jgi:hypothetical protein